jgi:hypothetical protein
VSDTPHTRTHARTSHFRSPCPTTTTTTTTTTPRQQPLPSPPIQCCAIHAIHRTRLGQVPAGAPDAAAHIQDLGRLERAGAREPREVHHAVDEVVLGPDEVLPQVALFFGAR